MNTALHLMKSVTSPKAAVQALVLLLGMLAASDSGAVRSPTDIVAVPDTRNIPPDVLERWVKARCIYPGNRPVYEACVRTIAARLPVFDPSKPHYFGEKYSPTEYVKCRLRNQNNEMRCENYTLVRHESPIYWPNPKVPMPKLPDGPKESVYRPWMTNEQYFEALCKAEAGEFIYKTVEGVEGIYVIRPRPIEIGDIRHEDRYVIESPYGYENWETEHAHKIFAGPKGYRFLEAPRSMSSLSNGIQGVRRYTYIAGSKPSVWIEEEIQAPSSVYGYLWREIPRKRDREKNISGGELVILNIRTSEILAIKRGFILGGPIRGSHTVIYWRQGRHCRGDSTSLFRTEEFIRRVLQPVGPSAK